MIDFSNRSSALVRFWQDRDPMELAMTRLRQEHIEGSIRASTSKSTVLASCNQLGGRAPKCAVAIKVQGDLVSRLLGNVLYNTK